VTPLSSWNLSSPHTPLPVIPQALSSVPCLIPPWCTPQNDSRVASASPYLYQVYITLYIYIAFYFVLVAYLYQVYSTLARESEKRAAEEEERFLQMRRRQEAERDSAAMREAARIALLFGGR
jgi:hypothetical protein